MRASRLISRSQILAWLIAPCAAATLLACTQGEGETCQVNRDCADGLVCNREIAADRGVCIETEAMRSEGEKPAKDAVLPDDEPADDAGAEDDDAGAEQAGSSG